MEFFSDGIENLAEHFKNEVTVMRLKKQGAESFSGMKKH